MSKRKPKDTTPEPLRGTRQNRSGKPPADRVAGRPGKSAEATEQQRATLESRERREAEMAALLRQVGAARAQRDSAVAALEIIAAECPGPESPTERTYRGLAASALARVHELGRPARSRAPQTHDDEARIDV